MGTGEIFSRRLRDEVLQAEEMDREVEKAEDAFPGVQADLEWIYEIRVAHHSTSLRILKTSCPRFWKEGLDNVIDFTFPAWFSYVQYFPPTTEVEGRMRQVDDMADMALYCVEAYHYAAKKP